MKFCYNLEKNLQNLIIIFRVKGTQYKLFRDLLLNVTIIANN